jgi:hypothetical protein
MWDALRRGDSAPSKNDEARLRPAQIDDAEPMLVTTEEIPFIEVGPHKSMEASPSVLACSPTIGQAQTSGPGISGRYQAETAARLAGPTAAPPLPRIVPFRAVFLATPEMESEMPQNDPLSRLIAYL